MTHSVRTQYSVLSTERSPLTPWQRRGLWALFAAFLLFGGIVELRSAFLKRRMTDLDVYLRAAWAVRAGEDIYDITNENDWHYHYPPFFAIVLTPLADPPPGVDRAGMLPFAVSVALWYLFNVGCLAFAVHKLAQILEEDSPGGASILACQHAGRQECLPHTMGCRRWWALRALPVVICLIPAGQTLMRGQVGLILLALLSGMVAAWHRGRNVRAGLWLSAAICLKVIPAFLLIIPLWQRNLRFLAGCIAGLMLGLVVLPVAVFGWPRTMQYYVEYDRKVLRPGLGTEQEQARAKEIMEITSTDNQSLQAIIHNTMHLDRWARPAYVSPLVRGIHFVVGGLLTAITLAIWWLRPPNSALERVLFLGALIWNMLLLCPVTHLHYFCLCLPLVVGLVAAAALEHGYTQPLGMRWPFLMATFFICGLWPVLPGMEITRDIGLAMYGATLLWLAGCAFLHKFVVPPSGGPVPNRLKAERRTSASAVFSQSR